MYCVKENRRTNGCVTMLLSVQNLVSIQAYMCYLVFFGYTFLLLFTMHWIVSCFRLVVDLALFIFIHITVVFDWIWCKQCHKESEFHMLVLS